MKNGKSLIAQKYHISQKLLKEKLKTINQIKNLY